MWLHSSNQTWHLVLVDQFYYKLGIVEILIGAFYCYDNVSRAFVLVSSDRIRASLSKKTFRYCVSDNFEWLCKIITFIKHTPTLYVNGGGGIFR